jgi:hypothetical protein
MTLTNDDLKKIRGVVREEVEAEVGNAKRDLDSSISSVRLRNSYELNQVNNRLKNLEIGQRKIQKDVEYTVDFLDKQDIKTEKRIEKVERKLNLQPAI